MKLGGQAAQDLQDVAAALTGLPIALDFDCFAPRGNGQEGIRAQEGVAADFFATLDALEQERVFAARRKFEISRYGGFEIRGQHFVDRDHVALLGQLLKSFEVGRHHFARSASRTARFMTARGAVSEVQISNCAAACSRNISKP